MRRPGTDAPSIAPPTSLLARLAESGAPPPDPTTGKLAPAGGGRARSNEGVFVANVDPDGSVHLDDRPNVQWALPLPSAKGIGRAIGNHLESWYRDPYAMARRGGERDPSAEEHNGASAQSQDTRPDHGNVVSVPIVRFDVTDAIMRAAGQDPYASRKLAFLDQTRDERVAMGATHRARQLSRTEQLVHRHLLHVWERPDLTMDAKKQALFDLWDECTETGEPAAIEAGARARAHIIGFIRAHLPPDSPDAFTPDQLARHNARRTSTVLFAPYP